MSVISLQSYQLLAKASSSLTLRYLRGCSAYTYTHPVHRCSRVYRKYFTLMWRELSGLSGSRDWISLVYSSSSSSLHSRIRGSIKFEKLHDSFFSKRIFNSFEEFIWTINKYRRVYDGYIDVFSVVTIIFFEQPYPFPIQEWISGMYVYRFAMDW